MQWCEIGIQKKISKISYRKSQKNLAKGIFQNNKVLINNSNSYEYSKIILENKQSIFSV